MSEVIRASELLEEILIDIIDHGTRDFWAIQPKILDAVSYYIGARTRFRTYASLFFTFLSLPDVLKIWIEGLFEEKPIEEVFRVIASTYFVLRLTEAFEPIQWIVFPRMERIIRVPTARRPREVGEIGGITVDLDFLFEKMVDPEDFLDFLENECGVPIRMEFRMSNDKFMVLWGKEVGEIKRAEDLFDFIPDIINALTEAIDSLIASISRELSYKMDVIENLNIPPNIRRMATEAFKKYVKENKKDVLCSFIEFWLFDGEMRIRGSCLQILPEDERMTCVSSAIEEFMKAVEKVNNSFPSPYNIQPPTIPSTEAITRGKTRGRAVYGMLCNALPVYNKVGGLSAVRRFYGGPIPVFAIHIPPIFTGIRIFGKPICRFLMADVSKRLTNKFIKLFKKK